MTDRFPIRKLAAGKRPNNVNKRHLKAGEDLLVEKEIYIPFESLHTLTLRLVAASVDELHFSLQLVQNSGGHGTNYVLQ